jgi:hypothetical protein
MHYSGSAIPFESGAKAGEWRCGYVGRSGYNFPLLEWSRDYMRLQFLPMWIRKNLTPA